MFTDPEDSLRILKATCANIFTGKHNRKALAEVLDYVDKLKDELRRRDSKDVPSEIEALENKLEHRDRTISSMQNIIDEYIKSK